MLQNLRIFQCRFLICLLYTFQYLLATTVPLDSRYVLEVAHKMAHSLSAGASFLCILWDKKIYPGFFPSDALETCERGSFCSMSIILSEEVEGVSENSCGYFADLGSINITLPTRHKKCISNSSHLTVF